MGLDVDNPLLAELARYGVDRREVPVRRRSLLSIEGRYDLVTAMNIQFDRDDEGALWMGRDWAFFIEEIRSKLTKEGRAHFRLGIRQTLGQVLSRFAVRQRIRPGKKAEFTLGQNGLGRIVERLSEGCVWAWICISDLVPAVC